MKSLQKKIILLVTGYWLSRMKLLLKRRFGIPMYFFVVILLPGLVTGLMGCATIIEGAKGISGTSTKVLEEGRKDAIKKTFNCDYNTGYNNVLRILGNIGAYIYTKDAKKKMIAIYVSPPDDTTPVGIFFTEIDSQNTQIEISSPSIYAREFISEKLFSALE